jgi:CheY-like chemotaxis protein
VQLHLGQVEARSDGPGRGSEFIVRLPILADHKGQAPPAPSAAEPSAPIQRRILVVDDNEDSAVLLARLLALAGHQTATAHDGLKAVELVATYQPDMVLLDIGLPKMNGYDVCRTIRQQTARAAPLMVALTGWGQDEDRRRSLEAGFDVHLVKPVNYDSLKQLIETLPPRDA